MTSPYLDRPKRSEEEARRDVEAAKDMWKPFNDMFARHFLQEEKADAPVPDTRKG